MPCISLTPPALPSLPAPFTLGAALPAISINPDLCCKTLPYPLATPPIPLPPGILNPAFVAAANQGIAAVAAVLRGLAVKCPRE